MSFQLQQGAIAAELRKAGFPADAANRLAGILGNSLQQARSGPQTQDLTPQAMRKITPHVRKYQLQNVDFLEGDPDYRRAQTQPSETKARPTPAATVRTDEIPQQTDSTFRVGQGEFTDVRTEGDRVSVGLRVRKTGSFVTQDPTSGSLIGRNIRVQSQGGEKGFARLSLEEAGPDVIIKLQLDDSGLIGEAVRAAEEAIAPSLSPEAPTDACPDVPCAADSECGSGCICEDSACTVAECGPDRRCPNGGICVDGRCVECVTSDQCPAGYECVDGVCVECVSDADCPTGFVCADGLCVEDDGGGGPIPDCLSVQCGADADCGAGCVCIAGECVPADTAYYCCYESAPVEGEGPPAAICQLGPCFDGNGLDAPDLKASGPYATYEECCAAGCGCRYECSAGSCSQLPQGQYASPEECLQNCPDTGALGNCCETLPPNTSLNPTNCIVKRALDGDCQVARSSCPPEEADENGTVVIRRTWTAGLSCSLCAVTYTGACCLPDGSCEALCEGECEERGGTFKGASWIDCETERTSSGGLYDFPCENGNGQADCACEPGERIVDAGSSSRCEPCGEIVMAGNGDGLIGGVPDVSAGDTFDVYVRSCDSQGTELGVPARVVRVSMEGGEEQLIGVQGTFTADRDGQLVIRGGAWGMVCLTPSPVQPPDPTEVSCTECCHSYSADFTTPPSCPGGWTLELGDGDGDGVPDAPSSCTKCEELQAGDDGSDSCVVDEGSQAIAELVAHINGSADKIVDVTAADVLASGVTAPSNTHFTCPDGKCYAGVTDINDCPGGNPLP